MKDNRFFHITVWVIALCVTTCLLGSQYLYGKRMATAMSHGYVETNPVYQSISQPVWSKK